MTPRNLWWFVSVGLATSALGVVLSIADPDRTGIWILVTWFVAIALGMRIRLVPWMRFDSVATHMWLFALGLNLIPQLVASLRLSLLTVLLVMSSHAMLLAGFAFGHRRQRKHPAGATIPNPRPATAPPGRMTTTGLPGAVDLLLISGVAMIFVTGIAALQRGQLPVIGAFGGVFDARLTYLAGSSSLGPFGEAAQLLKYPSVVLIALIPSFWSRKRRTAAFIGSLTAISVADASFRLGGRADLVFVALVFVSALMLRYRLRPSAVASLLILAATLFATLGVNFMLARNPNFDGNEALFTRRLCGYEEPGPWLQGQSTAHQGAMALALCYFSAPIANLDTFVSHQSERSGLGHTFGAYNFGLIARPVFADSRVKIAQFYASRGLGENLWATGVRDSWLDFGLFAPIPFFFLGWGMARFGNRQLRDAFGGVRWALLTPIGFMVPFMSPLVIPTLVYPLIVVELLRWYSARISPSREIGQLTVRPSTQLPTMREASRRSQLRPV